MRTAPGVRLRHAPGPRHYARGTTGLVGPSRKRARRELARLSRGRAQVLKQLHQCRKFVGHLNLGNLYLSGTLPASLLTGDHRYLRANFVRLFPIENLNTAVRVKAGKICHIAKCNLASLSIAGSGRGSVLVLDICVAPLVTSHLLCCSSSSSMRSSSVLSSISRRYSDLKRSARALGRFGYPSARLIPWHHHASDRERSLTAGERQGVPARVFAPQRGLSSMGVVTRG
jgi:hypothetical protein